MTHRFCLRCETTFIHITINNLKRKESKKKERKKFVQTIHFNCKFRQQHETLRNTSNDKIIIVAKKQHFLKVLRLRLHLIH